MKALKEAKNIPPIRINMLGDVKKYDTANRNPKNVKVTINVFFF